MDWLGVSAPIGTLGVASDGTGICGVRFEGPIGPGDADGPLLLRTAEEFAEYFAGERTGFDLPLSVRGGSPFERAVWAQIAAIPYGEMRTYGQIAAAVGDRNAARAVGIACNRNPLPILIPCHRVVGAGGTLVGFGGGLPRKRYLLELEARILIERTFR